MPNPETVTVACNWPQGILAEVCEMEIFEHSGIKEARRVGQPVRFLFQGPRAQRLMERDGTTIGEASNVAGGYGLTPVPKDFAERWFKDNANSPMVTGGHVFIAHARGSAGERGIANAAAEAKERGKSARVGEANEPLKPTTIDAASGRITSGDVDPRGGRGRVHTADKPADGA